MQLMFQKLAQIGVSEFLLVFLLLLAFSGAIAISTNVNFQQVILPPAAPNITAILGDPELGAVLIIGETEYTEAPVRVYAFSEPVYVETTSDREGIFFAAFTRENLQPGIHEFTAAVVLASGKSSDPAARSILQVTDDYRLLLVAGRPLPESVQVGEADAATRSLLRTIINNQKAAQAAEQSDLPQKNNTRWYGIALVGALFVLVAVETILLLRQRARRKAADGKNFFHLGTGLYRLPEKRH